MVILMLVNIGPRVTDTSGRWESALASAMVGATLLLALRASGLSKRLQNVADIIVLVVVGGVLSLAIASMFNDSLPLPTKASPFLVVLLAALAPVAVMRRLLQHRQVTRGTLLGAISGYLLLPIAFFYLFLNVSLIEDRPFFGEPMPTQAYMYFSLTTITTTGYGDVTAASDVGRMLAMAEAVMGQIYLVTFVAMLVGLFIAGRRTIRIPLTDPGPQPSEPEAQSADLGPEPDGARPRS